MPGTPVKSLTPAATSSSSNLTLPMVGECPLGDTALGFEDWAKYRQSLSSFLAKEGEDAQLRAKLQDVAHIAAILEIQGLRAVRDILGL